MFCCFNHKNNSFFLRYFNNEELVFFVFCVLFIYDLKFLFISSLLMCFVIFVFFLTVNENRNTLQCFAVKLLFSFNKKQQNVRNIIYNLFCTFLNCCLIKTLFIYNSLKNVIFIFNVLFILFFSLHYFFSLFLKYLIFSFAFFLYYIKIYFVWFFSHYFSKCKII